MLLWGQANPTAYEDSYQGVYLNKQDMVNMIQQIEDAKRKSEKIPVLIEHTGEKIGHVVSAWIHKDTLQCCLELSNNTLESAIGSHLVHEGLVKELSLGYVLDVKHTKNGIQMDNKILKEISIVKKGARENCKILGITGKKKD